jgi:dienelactone hydrolase
MLLPALLTLALVTPVTPGPVLTDVPAKPDPSVRYVFYLHGRILETQGRQAVSPDFGRYEYDAILGALAARGFTVISEVRMGDAGQEFVDKVAGQVRRLRQAGVPATHIGVVGASKGGGLTLRVSSAVADPDIAYVVLAGCGGGSVERAPTLAGRILSIYDAADRFNPSCGETFARAPQLTGRHEIVVKLGLDHGLLYKPHADWIDPAVHWILRRPLGEPRPPS